MLPPDGGHLIYAPMHVALGSEGQLYGPWIEGHDRLMPQQAWALRSALVDLINAVLQFCSANRLICTF